MDFIKFLGTAGARVVVAKQLRASGGIWLSLDGTNLLIDPGPGCLVHCFSSHPKLDPTTLDGIILTHKHLDHAADINTMMEAMTIGGKERRGVVLAPGDALGGDDPVVLKYNRNYVAGIEVLQEKASYKVGQIKITTPVKHIHGVETYGLMIEGKRTKLAYITDTKYFPELAGHYRAEIVVISVLSTTQTPFDHLNIENVKLLVNQIRPKLTILTHFGVWLLEAGPETVAADLSKELKCKVVAARDGEEILID
ncbi:hypothetical protein A2311_05855 [candidate division WOR-1 bacterium RIFOXYB2_FULL_48_7]|uniref:Metallo-beta-lactamase domain-containing protein n=1 Tax=candidate division WOR-1 bacterium RIFOXYB2_FULL_48_7 TaxID=1802583 RepID=A0A1F4T9F4_UNCSA|nr:MAG: hypothetical protein A2311_05855 [candidate division WOR-1 bacterium RIFOXYB2_FULL_48_7]